MDFLSPEHSSEPTPLPFSAPTAESSPEQLIAAMTTEGCKNFYRN